LIIREFSEEVILLSGTPDHNGAVTQIPFCCNVRCPQGGPTVEYFDPVFAAAHIRLRYEHDEVVIKRGEGRRLIEPLTTPFVVEVTHHLPNLKELEKTECHNVIFSLNPGEFGIEAIWLCTFSLANGEYLLDGELDAGHNMLIRSPVMLLDVEFLREEFNWPSPGASLGELLIDNGVSPECKKLREVPSEHYVLFDADVKFRRYRLEQLNARLETRRLSTRDQTLLRRERDMIVQWLNQYEVAFQQAAAGCGLANEALRTLCPVTWKTLELFFAHGIKFPDSG